MAAMSEAQPPALELEPIEPMQAAEFHAVIDRKVGPALLSQLWISSAAWPIGIASLYRDRFVCAEAPALRTLLAIELGQERWQTGVVRWSDLVSDKCTLYVLNLGEQRTQVQLAAEAMLIGAISAGAAPRPTPLLFNRVR